MIRLHYINLIWLIDGIQSTWEMLTRREAGVPTGVAVFQLEYNITALWYDFETTGPVGLI